MCEGPWALESVWQMTWAFLKVTQWLHHPHPSALSSNIFLWEVFPYYLFYLKALPQLLSDPSFCAHRITINSMDPDTKLSGLESKFCHKHAPCIWSTYLILPAFTSYWLSDHNITHYHGCREDWFDIGVTLWDCNFGSIKNGQISTASLESA